VVVADEAGVAINPAEEAGIGETVDSVREEGISVAINPAEESGIGETVDPVKEKEARKKKSCERNCKPMRNGQPQTAVSLLYSLKVYFLRKLYII